MSPKIRNVKPEDVRSLVNVFYTTWLATYPNKEFGITEDDIHHNFKDSYTSENIERRAKHIKELPTNERYVAAVIDDSIVGLSRAILHKDKNQLQALYVLPAFQGRGIGKMLWDTVRKDFNIKKPTIVHVATYNTPAISFYKKLGFSETGKVFSEERFRMKSGNIILETELVLSPNFHNIQRG